MDGFECTGPPVSQHIAMLLGIPLDNPAVEQEGVVDCCDGECVGSDGDRCTFAFGLPSNAHQEG